MRRSILLSAVLLLLPWGLSPVPVLAATEGRLEQTSSGNIEISLSILPSMQIHTVTEVHLNISDRSRDAHFSEAFCVTGNQDSRYTVLAYGSGSTSSGFLLRNANNEALAYDVSFLGDPQRNEYDPLKPGVASPPYELSSQQAACNEKTAFRITFRSEDLQPAGPGLYSGYLTMVVSPL